MMSRDEEPIDDCPFCGKTPEVNDYRDKPSAVWVLTHRGCPALGNFSMTAYSHKRLAEQWNGRAAIGEGDIPTLASRVLADAKRMEAAEDAIAALRLWKGKIDGPGTDMQTLLNLTDAALSAWDEAKGSGG